MAGVSLPITPLVHQHLATKPIPGPRAAAARRRASATRRTSSTSARRSAASSSAASSGSRWRGRWTACRGTSRSSSSRRTGSSSARSWRARSAACPILGRAEMAHLTNGPEGITPDSRPLLGPVPGRARLLGRGRALAHGLRRRRRDRRHHRGVARRGRAAVRRRRDERAALRPGVRGPRVRGRAGARVVPLLLHAALPHDENESVRERRLSPLDGRVPRRSAACSARRTAGSASSTSSRAGPAAAPGADQRAWGWGRPAFFDRVGEEHRAVRERAGLLDMTSFGKLDVRGPGALATPPAPRGQRRREAAR